MVFVRFWGKRQPLPSLVATCMDQLADRTHALRSAIGIILSSVCLTVMQVIHPSYSKSVWTSE